MPKKEPTVSYTLLQNLLNIMGVLFELKVKE